MTSHSPGTLWHRLRKRKFVQWALAYLAGAWVLLQVLALATDSYAWPDEVMRLAFGVVAIGFLLALVLAWYHGERGAQRVSGTELLLLALVLLCGGGLLWRYGASADGDANAVAATAATDAAAPAAAAPLPRTAIAVLPFVSMSVDAKDAYIADGLTETLLHMLAQVEGLRVTARTSSFAFKGRDVDVREIGRSLGVGSVLEGSVQRDGMRLRITAQLIDTGDGSHVWSKSFDRESSDIFAIQDEISAEVAAALRGSLLPETQRLALSEGGTRDAQAYDLYLRARDNYWTSEHTRLAESERLLREALQRDPEFALAWAALADTLYALGWASGVPNEQEDAAMLEASSRAVELAPGVPEVVATRARMLGRAGKQPQASKDLLRAALAEHPDHPALLDELSFWLTFSGEVREATTLAQRAMALDPLDLELRADSAFKFLFTGQTRIAEELARSILVQAPDSIHGRESLANVLLRSGRLAEAAELYLQVLAVNPGNDGDKLRIALMLMMLEDYPLAGEWLARIADTSPEQAERWRGELCFRRGDRECLARLPATITTRSPVSGGNVLFGSSPALWVGDWAAVEHEARSRLESEAQLSSAGDSARNLAMLALAVLRQGRTQEARELAQRGLSMVVQAREGGADHQYLHMDRFRLHALLGQPEQAHESLRAAIVGGFRDMTLLESQGWFVLLGDDPALAALVAERRRDNARERAALQAVLKRE